MPDKDVQTIKDLIFYQYAKIIAKSAFHISNGIEAKKKHYGFIKTTFLELKNGIKSWSDITREDWQLVDSHKTCMYCGAKYSLHREHIVPKSLRITPRCSTCDKIQSIHNQIYSCSKCNAQKGTNGLYYFYRLRFPHQPHFYDLIPPLVEKKYLKTIYYCHVCAKTLNKTDIDGDNQLSVFDIDYVIHMQHMAL